MAHEAFRNAHQYRAIVFLLMLTLSLADATEQKVPTVGEQRPHVLVLDNSDSDFKAPPFDDSILFLNSKGKIVNRIGGLNLCQSVGRSRRIAASEDGRFFVVCENVADKLTAYDTSSGAVLWSLVGKFGEATIVKDVVYALTSAGTIHGDSVLTISREGKIIGRSKVGGCDIVVDSSRNCFWLVGSDIKKCNMNLQAVQTLNLIGWCAVSVDLSPDGSIWVAERKHSQMGSSVNRLLNISPTGMTSRIIPLKDITPLCVRVDKSDGSVWVTGKEYRFARGLPRKWVWPRFWQSNFTDYRYMGPRTRKYTAQGKLVKELRIGGDSIEVDPSDGSVWITGKSHISRYSADGKKLGKYGGLSDDHKWIAIVRGKTD